MKKISILSLSGFLLALSLSAQAQTVIENGTVTTYQNGQAYVTDDNGNLIEVITSSPQNYYYQPYGTTYYQPDYYPDYNPNYGSNYNNNNNYNNSIHNRIHSDHVDGQWQQPSQPTATNRTYSNGNASNNNQSQSSGNNQSQNSGGGGYRR